jgi:regulatory protein
MKLTKIVPQQKREGFYNIFIDGKYCFSLGAEALLETKLVSGQELSAEQVTSLKKKSEDGKLYNQALRYVAMRLRSRWEVETYLNRKGCSPVLAENILQRLASVDLINDEKFAKSWLTSRAALKPTSKRKLILELKQKHVPEEIINKETASDSTAELVALKQLIERKRKLPRYKDNQRLTQYLVRQGFNYYDVKTALNADN